jgi:anti-sigma regulatory factor (Ser/Thr protein kinase)
MTPTFQRALARNVQAYLPVAEEVERFCVEQSLGKAVTFKLRLIVEELVLNLIDHAVDPKTDRIDLRIEVDPSRVILTVEDDSAPFDPHSAPAFDKAKPLEERAPRGMGLHLVRTMAENMAYARIDGRNRLRVMLRRD